MVTGTPKATNEGQAAGRNTAPIDQETRSILDRAQEAFVSMDAGGFITGWNPAAQKTFGWAREEAIGRVLADTIIPTQHREAHWRGLRRFLDTGKGPLLDNRIEVVALHRDGREFPVELTVVATRSGAGYTFNAFLHDITERKRAEDENSLSRQIALGIGEAETVEDALELTLRKICEKTGWAFGQAWVRARDRPLLECSSSWYGASKRLEPFRRASESFTFDAGVGLPGRVLSTRRPAWIVDVRPDPNFPRAPAAREVGLVAGMAVPVLADEEVVAVLEFFVFEQRDEDLWFIDLVSSVAAQLGSLTERKRVEDELRSVKEALERSNVELERFAYDASHDLGEPLRVLSQAAICLAQDYGDRLDEHGRRLLTSVVDGSDRMQTLIADLLEYSRVSREPPERVSVDCSAVFRETLELLEESIAEKGATVTTDPLPTINAHPTQLRQIFQNLVSNALKFSGESPLRVHVSAVREPHAWRFSVQDNGIGIEPHQAKRVFEMFRRLHARDAYAGTGMGLSICERIVEGHGGRMWVEAAAGGGSVFHFTIPDSPVD